MSRHWKNGSSGVRIPEGRFFRVQTPEGRFFGCLNTRSTVLLVSGHQKKDGSSAVGHQKDGASGVLTQD